MPILEPGSWMHPDNRPEWCEVTSIGRFFVPFEGGTFETHHHEEHEIWMFSEGKGKIFVDGAEHYVQAGDIVLTRSGDVHDIVEVYESLRGFFSETGFPGGGRFGHLDGVMHDVPALPIPADFPVR